MMSLIRFAPTLLLAFGVASSAAGQDSTCTCTTVRISKPSEFALRSSGTITAIQTRPQGTLGQNIPRGYGIDGAYFFRLDQRGAFSLRLGAGIVDYGHEAKHVPLSPTIGRVQVKVKTTNYLSQFTIGPQLTWPRGLVRPYVNAGIGGQVFFTESNVDDIGSDDSSDLSTTNQSDWTSAWTFGYGVYVPFSRGAVPVSVDAGVQFVHGGRAQYLKPGSIQDIGNQVLITPLESADTRVTVVRLGLRIGL
jgi:opacity protein-like surface antigen